MAFQTALRLQQSSNKAAVCSGVSSRGVVAPRTLHARARGSSMITRVMDITSEAQFEQEVLKAEGPVLVDFWAPWCGPCKLVAPLMTWAEKEHEGTLKVVKVEHDANKGLIEKYKVYGLPALIVFKDGKMVEGSKNEGAIGKAMLEKYIQKHVLSTVNA